MKLWYLLISVLLVSCTQQPPSPPVPSGIVTDVHGYKYRLVEPERKNPDGTTRVEIWERIDPLETNRWYTPTLSSKHDTNNPPVFNSLMR